MGFFRPEAPRIESRRERHSSPTAPRSPWQNGHAERLIGSIRRECLDHIVVFGEAHLRQILAAYTGYYNPASEHPSVYVIEENRFC
jgi:transposase InsO family protein